jgi:small-conductance mechanosensitive channel
LNALRFIVRFILWTVIVLMTLDNLGVNVTTMVAGLGIGGIAVALAVQNILGDLFASLSIVIDKPFVIGDFVIVGEYMGAVEYVGLKTTRIRALGGEQIVFSNGDLLKARIRNFRRMRERRVLFSFGVLYQTQAELVEKVPAMVRGIVEAHQKVRFDRAHFKSFGESSLAFEVVYWMLDPDFNLYMDVQQKINLEMLRAFEREGIRFAYPTRTLVVDGPIRVEQAAVAAEIDGDGVAADVRRTVPTLAETLRTGTNRTG